MRVDNISISWDSGPDEAQEVKAVEEDWDDPVSLVVNGLAEAPEAGDGEEGGGEDERETELGLVDAVVGARESEGNPVHQGTSGQVTNEGCDYSTEVGEANLIGSKVVGSLREDLGLGRAEEGEPDDACRVGEVGPNDSGEDGHFEGTKKELGERSIRENTVIGPEKLEECLLLPSWIDFGTSCLLRVLFAADITRIVRSLSNNICLKGFISDENRLGTKENESHGEYSHSDGTEPESPAPAEILNDIATYNGAE